jgi:hypothetical protein
MNKKQTLGSLNQEQRRMAVAAAVLLTGGTIYLTLMFGVAPLIIVGLAALPAYWLWVNIYLRHPIEPSKLLPVFLLTSAGFAFHAIEEYLGHYGPAVGRLFGFAWTDQAFVIIVFTLLGALGLVGVGLQRRLPIAGLIAIVFMMTRIAELLMFTFPFIKPAVQPDKMSVVSGFVQGTWVQHMPIHYLNATHQYYWPGMYTVILPLLPAVIGLVIVWRSKRA